MEFVFVGGDPALDLVGTVQRRRTLARDLLREPADLGAWTAAAGLVDQPVQAGPEELEQAHRLREAVYRLGLAAVAGEPYPTADRRLLNRLADGPVLGLDLRPDGTLRRTGSAAAVLATVARSAQELFALPLGAPIRECASEPCTRLYVDRSRRGVRRWCEMAGCGNRAKAAAFRERHPG
ncbi:ABATE domain-containing protein [Kitasatospora sp. NPDC002040]|uniref:CGNR zinc finger domain-containing protein n=1 Tax=Kitasatospora sp. NPDC002040 TaxID=3154661 RepID=UPI00333100F1